MNGIVEAAFLLDDADAAASAHELLRPYAHLPMVGSLGITCFGLTQRALGVASLTFGARGPGHRSSARRRTAQSCELTGQG
jgi:hypothetical protein